MLAVVIAAALLTFRAFFTVALRVAELLFPSAADARFATEPFFVVPVDFERCLTICRDDPANLVLLLGAAFFNEAFFTATFLVTDFFDFKADAEADCEAGVDNVFVADIELSIGGSSVAGATAVGPPNGWVGVATVLKCSGGVAEAASADSAEMALSEPSAIATTARLADVIRIRRDNGVGVRLLWERTGIHFYFL